MADPNDMNAAFAAAVSQRSANESNTAAFQQAVEAKKAAEQQAEALDRLKQKYGEQAASVEKARASNVAWGRSLRDGTAVRAARDLERLRREEEKYRREVELRARYGRVGGFAARHERGLGYAEYAASRAMGAANGLYNRGMSGTVESHRRDMELNLLGREVASIFKPLSDATTDLIRGFRKLLGGIGSGGQNALMLGGLGVSGALGIAGLARGGHLGGIGRLALGGGAAAAGLAGGLGLGEVAAGAVGMKMLGGLRGGAAGGGLAAAMRSAGGFGATPAVMPGASGAGGAMKWLGRAAVPFAALSEASGYYSDFEKRQKDGDGGLMAFAKGALELQANTLTFGLYGRGKDLVNGASDVFGGGKDKNRVTLAAGGFQELGSGYDQIAEAYGKLGGDDAPKETKEVADKLGNIETMFRSVLDAVKNSVGDLERTPGGR